MSSSTKYPVSAGKIAALEARMAELGIREQDIDERFIRGGGSGGQKINKSNSCVQLEHRPTGTVVRCQRERSQSLNRFLARRELCDRIERLQRGEVLQEAKEISKLRRQKARRSRRAKQKILEQKRKRAQVKALRGSVESD
ncbi:MAG: peptide chain release factor-like protein [Bdellovibrionota bacterium]|nr:MAG: peptide chain release factor-like protein [Bdellovibrionota bacterium]